VTYLGVALKRSRTPGKTLPLELPRLWAPLYKTGAALSPAVPVPRAAQLQLTTAGVLAGVLYPAAVHDLDYTGVDRFVASLTRRLTGCAKGSSATTLQCETGTLPSKFTAHRRATQYWLRVSRHACSPLCSLTSGVKAPPDALRTPRLSTGSRVPRSLTVGGRTPPPRRCGTRGCAALWPAQLRATSGPGNAGSPGPRSSPNATTSSSWRPNPTSARALTSPSTELRSGSAQSQADSATGTRGNGRPCPHRSKPGHFADPCDLLECDQAPSALLAAGTTVLSGTAALRVREHLVKLLCNTLVGRANEVPALRAVCPPLQ
jgi:hypothetical protein